jgi:hypothetical protein
MTFDGPDFIIAPCESCDRDVLTARDLDEHDALVCVCVHCGAVVDEHDSRARRVGPAELVEMDYFVDGYVPDDGHDKEGGCRGGSCGVRQP